MSTHIRSRTSSLVVLIAAVGVVGACGEVQRGGPDVQRYLGIWNYDQPNMSNLNNVAVLACPGGGGQCDNNLPLPLEVPQVGWVMFSLADDGTINGRTDQGCVWNFDVAPDGLELSSETQTCFNPTIGSAGTLTRWSVKVDGDKEFETITAISHQPDGVNIVGTMDIGSRTKVNGTGDGLPKFLGDWTYDPPTATTLVNIAATDKGTIIPQRGTVSFVSANDNNGGLVARTPDGCQWTLSVRGDTAEIDPAMQTCSLADGSEVSLHYWGIVTDDGVHINAFRAGSTKANGQETNEYLFVSELTKAQPAQ